MSAWQPIETAPRDGTRIAVLFQDGSQGVVSFQKNKGPSIFRNLVWQTPEGGAYHRDWPTQWMPEPST